MSKLNREIATKLGWTQFEDRNSIQMGGSWYGYPPNNFVVGEKHKVPNFGEDLNVMYVYERDLPLWRAEIYLTLLAEKVGLTEEKCGMRLVNASARDRAECFNKCLDYDREEKTESLFANEGDN